MLSNVHLNTVFNQSSVEVLMLRLADRSLDVNPGVSAVELRALYTYISKQESFSRQPSSSFFII